MLSNITPVKILHSAVALAALSVLLLSAVNQSGDETVNIPAFLFLVGIVVTDTLKRKIPNSLILVAIVAGIAANGYTHAAPGVTAALAGMTVGLLLLLPFYLCGGMGAGDVKALAALGSMLGPTIILQIFLYTALIGGAICLLHFFCTTDLRKQSREATGSLRAFLYASDSNNSAQGAPHGGKPLPYAPAMAFGFTAFLHWGPIISLPW